MKHLQSILFLLFLIFTNVYAQKKSVDDEYTRQVSIYNQALNFNDLMVARNAVFQIMALRPTADNWNDTLCMLYFSSGMYVQTILTGEKILKNDPTKININEMIAISYDKLGFLKESLEIYQTMLKQQNEIRFQYNILILEYRLKRLVECLATAESIIARPEAFKDKIRINVSDQQYQDVPYAASVYNIMGMATMELNLKEQAERYFQKSLEIAPDFVLPKNNLTLLQPNEK